MALLVKRNRTLLPELVNDLFDTGRFFDFDRDLLETEMAVNLPKVNVLESDKDYKLELAVPGLEKKDFKIEVNNGLLSISAEKTLESKEEKENYCRREFSYNSFNRSFRLPENVLSDKIDANYLNGVLRLVLPKKKVTVSKQKTAIKVS